MVMVGGSDWAWLMPVVPGVVVVCPLIPVNGEVDGGGCHLDEHLEAPLAEHHKTGGEQLHE